MALLAIASQPNLPDIITLLVFGDMSMSRGLGRSRQFRMRVIRCSKTGISKITVGNLNVGNLFLFGNLGTCLHIPNLCTNLT